MKSFFYCNEEPIKATSLKLLCWTIEFKLLITIYLLVLLKCFKVIAYWHFKMHNAFLLMEGIETRAFCSKQTCSEMLSVFHIVLVNA